jgi:hypothetical protein
MQYFINQHELRSQRLKRCAEELFDTPFGAALNVRQAINFVFKEGS